MTQEMTGDSSPRSSGSPGEIAPRAIEGVGRARDHRIPILVNVQMRWRRSAD